MKFFTDAMPRSVRQDEFLPILIVEMEDGSCYHLGLNGRCWFVSSVQPLPPDYLEYRRALYQLRDLLE